MIKSVEQSAGFPSVSVEDMLSFVLRWGPRAIVVFIAGYYSLGIAYHWGVMAKIDQIAIELLLPSVGYAGLGAIMPTVQWYAAWAVRIVAGFAAGIVWEVVAYVAKKVFDYFYLHVSQLLGYKQNFPDPIKIITEEKVKI